MTTVTVSKKNETYMHVDADTSTMLELNDFFTFTVPGYQFTPAYRSKMWDGKIRLYNIYTKELYVGLMPYVKDFCRQNDYEFLNNCKFARDKVEDVETYINNMRFFSGGKEIEIRQYQRDAILEAVKQTRTLLLSPTGSGKSLIIYTLMRWNQTKDRRQLIIVPTTSLVEQLYGDFADYAGETGWKVSENCSRIYSGKEKIHLRDIKTLPNTTISTWQSIYKMPKSFFENFDVVYGDECLHPETQIKMGDGSTKEIRNVVIGEEVLTFNETTLEYEKKPVLKIHHNISKAEQMFEVLLDDGTSVKITGNHKVLLTSGIWKRVDELKIDDCINSIE